MIKAIVWSVCQPGTAEKIAQFTVDESRLGNYEGKFLKIFRKTRATLMDIIDDKSVGVIEEDKVRNLYKNRPRDTRKTKVFCSEVGQQSAHERERDNEKGLSECFDQLC